MRRNIFAIFMIGLVALLLLLPVVRDDLYLLTILSIALCYSVLAASWDFFSGYTGRENFGISAFVAVGGYLVGLVTSSFNAPPILSILMGFILAGIVGFLIGLPTLRLHGPYFALATLALVTIAENLVLAFARVTGGEDGLYGLPYLTVTIEGSYYYVLVFAIISISILFLLGRSNFGLILKAINSDEEATRSSGIKVTRYKLLSLSLSAAFAGATGALLAHFYGYIGRDVVFQANLLIIIMATVGGTGFVLPAALGGITISLLTEYIRAFGELKNLTYTVVLMVMVLFVPGGLFSFVFAKNASRKRGVPNE
ncbi:branched-chain amino acid ABC transporter permease [uncultured Mesotoga sp.]|uniref:branched-chain amino acid ABC transporter permease n=1 Tax=uncultured Mesotoga sp. TaxID=1184400 RepID=UPI0002CC1C9C|nr:branched-chain amino acid ABC transporter permease [uncultured Mesotoga sp.]CCU83772.1 Branched-chain amino acid transport system permease protein [Mesotoga infera]